MTRFCSIILIAISFSAPARAQSALRVRLANNAPLTVSVDGRYFNRRGTSVTVGDLPPGLHVLRIFGYEDMRYARPYQEVIYRGRVRTDAGMVTNITYDPYGGTARIQQQDMNGGDRNPDNNNYSDRDGYSRGNNYRGNDTRTDPNRGVYDDRSTSEQNQNVPDNQQSAPVTEPYQPVAAPDNKPAASPVIIDEGTMTEAKTTRLRTKVAAKGTDTEKLKALKEGLQNEKISTFQVSVMMDWFSFESSKLDFAKWAYDITTDKENYGDLTAKFTYKDSEEDLRKFLQTK